LVAISACGVGTLTALPHAKTMLLCVSSRDLVEMSSVALGELAVVAQASFDG